MKPSYWTIILLFLFFLLSAKQSSAQGYLRARGKTIVDATEKEIILRGMGLGGWMLQEPYMLQLSDVAMNQGAIRKKITTEIGEKNTQTFYDAWLKNHCTKADVDSMKAWGFNSIRLPMHYNLYTLPVESEPVRGKQTWLNKGFEMTDSLLRWCQANEIYLILDLHAAPGAQGNDNAISDRDTTKPSLWQSEDNKQKTVALWRKLAERYATEKWIGGYDLINETNWGFQNQKDKNGCAETDNSPLRKLLIDITQAIRQVDKNHAIFIEGNCWANNYKGVFPLWDNNIVVSFHKYWNDNNQAAIQQFLDLREQYNVPLWMGESGENSNVWFRSAISLLESNNIGWAWWPLKKLGVNNPLQIPTNKAYQKLVSYWKGKESKPSAAEAFNGLMQLAADSRIDKNIYHSDVVDAMFRQVRDNGVKPFAQHNVTNNPLINAVNFDLGKNGEAYYAIDSANYWVSNGKRTQWNKGWTYRNDAVDIAACTDEKTNGYSVSSVAPTEWLQYSFIAEENSKHNLQLRMAASQEAVLDIIINDQVATKDLAVQASGDKWVTVTINNIELKKGMNRLRIAGKSGEFSLNYFMFSKQ